MSDRDLVAHPFWVARETNVKDPSGFALGALAVVDEFSIKFNNTSSHGKLHGAQQERLRRPRVDRVTAYPLGLSWFVPQFCPIPQLVELNVRAAICLPLHRSELDPHSESTQTNSSRSEVFSFKGAFTANRLEVEKMAPPSASGFLYG